MMEKIVDKIIENIGIIKNIYAIRNTETGFFFAIYILSIIYIFKTEKNIKIKTFFGYYSAFMLLVIWNPLYNYIVGKFVNFSSMYRMYFMLPATLSLAYVSTKIVVENNKKIMKVLSFSVIVAIILIYGKFIFNEWNTVKVGNLYKLPDESVEVAWIIGSDKETLYKKAIVPYEMSSHIRQIDASIELYYSRLISKAKDANGNIISIDTDIPPDDYYPVHMLNSGNVEYITEICKESNTNYIVFAKDVELDDDIENYGYRLYAETFNYSIYREYNKENIKTEINQIDIEAPNLLNEYSFLFISDMHISIVDKNEEDEQIYEYSKERMEAFKNDNKNKNIAKDIYSHFINIANESDIDAVLLGGDIIAGPQNANIEFLKDNFSILNKPWIYVLGNHELNFYFKEKTRKEYPQDLMNLVEVFKIEYDDLIVLGINNSEGKISEEMLQEVTNTLEQGKYVVILMHIPIATERLVEKSIELRDAVKAIGNGGKEPDEATQRFIDVILDNENVIGVLAGHLHFEHEDILTEGMLQYVTEPGYKGIATLVKIHR